jgi:hypothetical protein
VTSNLVELARSLEADAVRYPGERAEILLEAADAWRKACEYDRAASLLTELIEAGGEDGCHARFQLAEVHFERGTDELASVELAALARDPALKTGTAPSWPNCSTSAVTWPVRRTGTTGRWHASTRRRSTGFASRTGGSA